MIFPQVRQNRLSGWYILVVSPNEQHLENITSYLSEIIVIDIAFLLINKPYEGNVDIQVQVRTLITPLRLRHVRAHIGACMRMCCVSECDYTIWMTHQGTEFRIPTFRLRHRSLKKCLKFGYKYVLGIY